MNVAGQVIYFMSSVLRLPFSFILFFTFTTSENVMNLKAHGIVLLTESNCSFFLMGRKRCTIPCAWWAAMFWARLVYLKSKQGAGASSWVLVFSEALSSVCFEG